MHELSIALRIIEAAAEEAARQGSRVVAVHVNVGALSGIVPKSLASAFELAREATLLAGAALVVHEIPVETHCPVCERDCRVRFPDLRCTACNAPTPRVVRGRELEIVALEVET
jgi:hydrogenase nickel incorporation protein HypA/HybF